MTNVSETVTQSPAGELRREMGFWDVLLFNIAAVLGPRWIAAAAHNGPSSIVLWILAALFFFVPTALIIAELSSRFPGEGGLYVWSKEAFGEFHGFVAGWSYWVYTFFYFPGLLVASAAMAAYIGGPGAAYLAQSRAFLLAGSLAILFVAVAMNIVGLNIGKWLQNAGGVGTYVPLLMLLGIAAVLWAQHGSATPFPRAQLLPRVNLDTVNFWSQIAFAFTGLELCCAMSDEIKNPRVTFPRAILFSGVLIALIYILGTIAVLWVLTPEQVDAKSGVFQAITQASTLLRVGLFGVVAALLVTAGNAGGVGTTVAGASRIPFVVGIDHYLPEQFGRVHPRWHTPHVSILVQAIISGVVLIAAYANETTMGAYQILVDAATILYFIPFLYMYAAAIKLAYRPNRQGGNVFLVPGGKPGVWIASLLAFVVCGLSILFSLIPPGDTSSKFLFELKLVLGTAIALGIGLVLYGRGARKKAAGN